MSVAIGRHVPVAIVVPVSPGCTLYSFKHAVVFLKVWWHAGQEGEGNSPAEEPEGPFQVSLQYNGPAVLLWLWSNAHSSENTGLKAHPIKHTAGNSGVAPQTVSTAHLC